MSLLREIIGETQDYVVLELMGSVTFVESPEFLERLRKYRAEYPTIFLSVPDRDYYLKSTGLATLIHLGRQNGYGSRIVFCGETEGIMDGIKIFKLDRRFKDMGISVQSGSWEDILDEERGGISLVG